MSDPAPNRTWLQPLVVFGVLLVACFVFAYVMFSSLASVSARDEHAWTSGKGPRIGVVEVSGVISSSRRAIEQLIELRRDPAIKAIVVRVDSPGGSVGPSQEIFRAIERARRDKKVVVSMGTVAASGGYYIACAADEIWASPGTITGSIGVISEFPEVDGLLDLLHVKTTTIKSGALKDVGSPLRPITQPERDYLQAFVGGIYEQFLDDVARSRKLDKQALRPLADGRILSGLEAQQAHLVDHLGNLEDAVEAAARLAGASGDPVPVFVRPRRGLLGELLHESTEAAIAGARDGVGAAAAGSVQARDPRF